MAWLWAPPSACPPACACAPACACVDREVLAAASGLELVGSKELKMVVRLLGIDGLEVKREGSAEGDEEDTVRGTAIELVADVGKDDAAGQKNRKLIHRPLDLRMRESYRLDN